MNDPAFHRPDAYVSLCAGCRASYAQADNELCRIEGAASRHFVRSMLLIQREDDEELIRIGIWAEVSDDAFMRILDLWSDADQASEPPFEANLANHLPGYPETLGLPCSLRLTGPKSRPVLALSGDLDHPLAQESARVPVDQASDLVRSFAR